MDSQRHKPLGQPSKYRSMDGFTHPRSARPSINTIPHASSIISPRYESFPSGTLPSFASAPIPLSQKSKRRSKKKALKLSMLAVVMGGVVIGGFLGYKALGNLDKVFHGNIFSDAHALFSNTKLKGEAQGRVNILLAGYQGNESDEGPLTDSIMVVSIDTQNNTAFTISIPRDLWVNIPGNGHEKINAANTYASFNQQGYFSGGMGKLQQVVQQDLGIPINYYALINYTAFENVVNAVGGITVNIQSPDPRGLYDPNVDKVHGGPLKLPNGSVTLNGLHALALALARGDSPYAYGFPQSDISRTKHQRQMLIALEQKALSVGVLSNPIIISNLFNAFGNNVKTDFNLADVLRLAQLAKLIKVSNIQSYGLSYGGTNPLLTNYLAPDGEDALIPKAGLDNFGQIQQYYQQLTSNNPIAKEAPTIEVLNASKVNGLALKESATLKKQGFNVVGIADASSEYPATMVVDNSSGHKPNSLHSLQKTFTGTTVIGDLGSAEAREAQGYTADFVVVLGQNRDSQPVH